MAWLVKMPRMKKLFHLGEHASKVRPQPAGACHNCHAPVSEKFCGQCGQPSHVHVASAQEFIHHFVGHYIAAEGKLWGTLMALLFRPGLLTLEFVRGRRGRYIDPLRLLLTISLLAFLALKGLTYLSVHSTEKPAIQAQQTAADAHKQAQPLSLTGRVLFAVFEASSPKFADNFAKYRAMRDEAQAEKLWNTWLAAGPTIILCLIPIVAAILKLLHVGTGWRYGEHLVFSLHLQAVALLVFLAWFALDEYTKPLALLPIGGLLVYCLLAMRRLYGGAWPVLLVRWAALAVLEFKCFGALIIIAFYMTMT